MCSKGARCSQGLALPVASRVPRAPRARAAAAAAGAAPAAPADVRYARLLAWASDGIEPVRVAVRDNTAAGGGRGLFAEADVPPGGVLLSVPFSRVFTSKVRRWVAQRAARPAPKTRPGLAAQLQHLVLASPRSNPVAPPLTPTQHSPTLSWACTGRQRWRCACCRSATHAPAMTQRQRAQRAAGQQAACGGAHGSTACHAAW